MKQITRQLIYALALISWAIRVIIEIEHKSVAGIIYSLTILVLIIIILLIHNIMMEQEKDIKYFYDTLEVFRNDKKRGLARNKKHSAKTVV